MTTGDHEIQRKTLPVSIYRNMWNTYCWNVCGICICVYTLKAFTVSCRKSSIKYFDFDANTEGLRRNAVSLLLAIFHTMKSVPECDVHVNAANPNRHCVHINWSSFSGCFAWSLSDVFHDKMTMTHRLGLGHKTMVFAVCLSIFV